MTLVATYLAQGFLSFRAEPGLLRWAGAARQQALAITSDSAQAYWLRCGGTWFVGVDALPNDGEGRLSGGPPLAGKAVDFIRHGLGLALPLHRAQLSVCYPGYPQPSPEESEEAYGFRLRRDAAHVDGLIAEGPGKRRVLKEPHAYVLGLPLTRQSAGAAPLTVWEGSHLIMRAMFETALAQHAPEDWPGIDLTSAYKEARRKAFAECRRIELAAAPGEAVVLHRHLLHGVAPWKEGAEAPREGRMIAYFRPQYSDPAPWLSAP